MLILRSNLYEMRQKFITHPENVKLEQKFCSYSCLFCWQNLNESK
jgi:wyosine [tRNA(Phe)-imidazoG37] synthetase (radical SAM superfamily)